ncbi:hypothetical protein [Halalkalicoccus salilacus]|uniref:hypothetical protein n=1 Tax=Halalkalicoccus sp. GCM10025704 TaxID=3252662 RepID=UPI00361714A1
MGLIATEHNEAELVHTTLQAIRRGYEVFVTYASESEPETIDLARLLDARIVEPDYPGANPDSLLSTLATTARRNGCPGLIYQFDVSTPIDYGRSERELADRSSYTIEAETSHARRRLRRSSSASRRTTRRSRSPPSSRVLRTTRIWSSWSMTGAETTPPHAPERRARR